MLGVNGKFREPNVVRASDKEFPGVSSKEMKRRSRRENFKLQVKRLLCRRSNILVDNIYGNYTDTF